MILDKSGTPIKDNSQNELMEPEDLNDLFIFDPNVILTPLNAKTICEAVAKIQLGLDVPAEDISKVAQEYYNYGMKEGLRKSGDLEHIHIARQVLKDFLLVADNVYEMLATYVQPDQVSPLAEDEDASEDR
ncbi:MAG: hypothetical protein KOO63_07990 [Bacteroidales bacterium]|nr:hypothetical protein [Candidatus Latescibacterota bacterium]